MARLVDAAARGDEEQAAPALRPARLTEFIGQRQETGNLRVFIAAAKKLAEPVPHLLFCGPPGLGKTTLARLIAAEMGANLYATSGPAVANKGEIAGMLSQLEAGAVFFIDEIHRLNPAVEETLYTAMEDRFIDMSIGQGVGASTFKLDLPPFTLVGATTRQGLLTKPLLSRFGHVAQLAYYSVAELAEVVRRAAAKLGIDLTPEGGDEIARRSRGTPRLALRWLHRVRAFAIVEADGTITREIADGALTRLQVDRQGLDEMDRRLLTAVIERYGGGPVGLDAIAAAIGEEAETLETVYEPYLVLHGFLLRTPRGRVAAPPAYAHLGLRPPPPGRQGSMW